MVQLHSWLHSTFKELSNDTSPTQIRVKRRSYSLDKLNKENSVASDRVFSIVTKNLVTTEFSLLRQSFSVATENFVATEFSLLR